MSESIKAELMKLEAKIEHADPGHAVTDGHRLLGSGGESAILQDSKLALILEDDPQVATLQQIYLSELGYKSQITANSKDALQFVVGGDVDLLIVDYKLAEPKTGLDFYQELLTAGLSIPAIMVTALGNEELLAEAMRLGVRGFVLKTPNYWRDFNDTVQRVSRQVAFERQALQAEAAREARSKIEAALEAAEIGYWRWNIQTDAFLLSPTLRKALGLSSGTEIKERSDFLKLAHPEDCNELIEYLDHSKLTQQPLGRQVRFISGSGEALWFSLKGGPFGKEPGIVTGMASDVTEQRIAELRLEESNREITSLNAQLQASMTETHHRVKNSLQIVNSLLNMELRRKSTLSAAEIAKVISHIQAFAALHDILSEESKEISHSPASVMQVELRELFSRLLEILTPLSEGRLIVERIDSLRVSPRQSSALGLLLNEFVSNAMKHGKGAIRVRMRQEAGDYVLAVENEGSAFPEGFSPDGTNRTGLRLMESIAQRELGSKIEFYNLENGSACARVRLSSQRGSADAPLLDSQSSDSTQEEAA
jgi:two-component sensor histidine kinase/FixJ family two-component response regulator